MIFAFHGASHQLHLSFGIFNNFISMGAIYMTGFFMLSGFVLYYVHGQRDTLSLDNLKRFYWKRFATIVPIYWAIYLLYMIFSSQETWKQNLILFPVEIQGLQSIFPATFSLTHNGGTWFISCILFAYLFYPFLANTIRQMSMRQCIILLVILSANLLFAPFYVWGLHLPSIYDNPIIRLMEFTIGIILAEVWRKAIQGEPAVHMLTKLASWYLLAAEMLVLIVAVSMAVYLHIGLGNFLLYSWIALPLFTLQIFTLAGLDAVFLHSRIVQYASAVSYAFFLAQFFVWQLADAFFSWIGITQNLLQIVLSFLLCFAISVLLHELVEVPAKRFLLRRR